MHRLRRKLGDDPGRPRLLQTVLRVGVLLNVDAGGPVSVEPQERAG
jgi:DNA-binding response OmpR family regulator